MPKLLDACTLAWTAADECVKAHLWLWHVQKGSLEVFRKPWAPVPNGPCLVLACGPI